jgi:hypothetical protein
MSNLDLPTKLRKSWPLLAAAAIGAVLLFANVGSDYLWADEGDTAVLASNIAKFGLPRAWDGSTFMDSDFGARVNRDLVMVSSPWLQYYVTAASFLVFGENTFAARFPFAVAGWLTLLMAGMLVARATSDWRAVICTSVLTISSVQFLLFCRQARYYAFAMLFSCLLIDSFLRMRSASRAVVFGIAAVLLFHTHPIGLFVVVALGGLTLIHPSFKPQRRWFWIVLPGILALTLPWFALAHSGYTENAVLVPSLRDFFIRLAQYLIECASVSSLIGVTLLWLAALLMRNRPGRIPLGQSETQLLLAILSVLVAYAVVMAATQRTAALWVTGIRYTSAVIPLLAIAAGILIVNVTRRRIFGVLALLILLAFTKLGQITPWTLWADKNPNPENKIVAVHAPLLAVDAFLPREDLLFVRDLWRKNVGTVGKCVQLLQQYANRNDLIITNYESEPLYFYTKLPQGMKIMRQDPIYEAAKNHGLPDYVFGVDHARWVAWRFNWDDYLGIRWTDVTRDFSLEGGQIVDIAEIPETGWENRENIHFHRFSGNNYLFAQETNLRPAHIFRIDWAQTP